MIQTET